MGGATILTVGLGMGYKTMRREEQAENFCNCTCHLCHSGDTLNEAK